MAFGMSLKQQKEYQRMKLSDAKIKASKPKTNSKSPLKLSDGEGLYLFVMPNGKKSWRFLFQYLGKPKTYVIGSYPEYSLKDAREERLKLRRMVIEGMNPVEERQKQREEIATAEEHTFGFLAKEWYELRKDKWKPRYADEVWKRLQEDILPYMGDMHIKEIEPPFLLSVIRKIEARGAIDLSKRQLQKCGEIFKYAIAIGKAVRDPSQDIQPALKTYKTEHFAAIDTRELPQFVKDLDRNTGRLYPSTCNAIWLMMLTFVRTGELINAEWKEIDFERSEWIIPAQRMKMGKSHIVPLSKQAIEILQHQKTLAGTWPHVFPSNVKPQKTISNNTILGGLKRMGYKGRMTGHGFRALAMSTIKQELHYRHEVVDRQLAHVPKSKIDRAYDRAKFLDERTVMMQEWSDYIYSLV